MATEALTTLGKRGTFEFTEKKSVFIGYAAPVSSEAEALAFVAEIKAKHSDARHNVSAYVVGGACHASDYGEPQGTGGVPVLDVIRKRAELTMPRSSSRGISGGYSSAREDLSALIQGLPRALSWRREPSHMSSFPNANSSAPIPIMTGSSMSSDDIRQ